MTFQYGIVKEKKSNGVHREEFETKRVERTRDVAKLKSFSREYSEGEFQKSRKAR